MTDQLTTIFPNSPLPKMPEEVGVSDLVFYMCHFTSYHDTKDYGGFVRAMAGFKKVDVTDEQVEASVPHVREFLEVLVPIVRQEAP